MTPLSITVIDAAVRAQSGDEGQRWLDESIAAVRADPHTVRSRFPAAGRHVGRGRLFPDAGSDIVSVHTVMLDDGARILLLHSMGTTAAAELDDLYHYGDAAERRAVLRALPFVHLGHARAGIRLVEDALRTNDRRLIAAALSSYACEHLPDAALSQAVLKCVFAGIPLAGMPQLFGRTTPETSRMLADYVHERVAAGRDIPAEVWAYIDVHPPVERLASIEAELDHPVEERRRAAHAALSLRGASRMDAGARRGDECTPDAAAMSDKEES